MSLKRGSKVLVNKGAVVTSSRGTSNVVVKPYYVTLLSVDADAGSVSWGLGGFVSTTAVECVE